MLLQCDSGVLLLDPPLLDTRKGSKSSRSIMMWLKMTSGAGYLCWSLFMCQLHVIPWVTLSGHGHSFAWLLSRLFWC
jgi:hypothetical protein